LSGDEDPINERKSAMGQQSVENSKMGIEGVNQYQVLGMISQNKELFLFESPVQIENDNKAIKEIEGYEVSGTGTGNVEQWLLRWRSLCRRRCRNRCNMLSSPLPRELWMNGCWTIHNRLS